MAVSCPNRSGGGLSRRIFLLLYDQNNKYNHSLDDVTALFEALSETSKHQSLVTLLVPHGLELAPLSDMQSIMNY